MKHYQEIIDLLPYKSPFHFVEELSHLDSEGCTGSYTIKEDEYFFEGHFPSHPVVPGVIITEIMAQIGLVCLGIYLLSDHSPNDPILPIFSNANVDFLAKAGPGNKLIVESKKIYFRFGKLKCKITCRLEHGTKVATGECSGMIVKKSQIE